MNLSDIFEPGWAEALEKYINLDKFSLLGGRIHHLRKSSTVYPPKDEVFRAFNLTPYNDVKVVILGQDPYHDGSADGLAFSNSKSNRVSPSLKNILEEIERDYPESYEDISHGKLDPADLSRWATQGVFLVNSSFTVEKGKPNSHKILWTPFTKWVIQSLQARNDIVWLMLGKEAQTFLPLINNLSHQIVTAAHPAADIYSGKKLFYTSGCFRKVNEALTRLNKSEIIW